MQFPGDIQPPTRLYISEQWRLFHRRIAYRDWLFRIKSSMVDSPLCCLCSDSPKDGFHFFVNCTYKWTFWLSALSEFGLSSVVTTPDDAWQLLVSLSAPSIGDPIPEAMLVKIDYILLSIWKYHWRCHFDSLPWTLAGVQAEFHYEVRFFTTASN